ncbi:MAG: RDD family protein, partial [Candidatus Dormibacteraeota bacterium]|nr:RDD family protein [Candidatus Dormibacteraeota bacterium]
PDSDEQFAEWYVWAKREVSSDPRVCLGVAQAGIEALAGGADRPAAEEAARKSVAGIAVVLLTKVSPWRQGYAQWYDWARVEFGGEPARLHRLTRIAIERLKSDGDAAQAAEAARSAAASDPSLSPPGSTSQGPSGSSWTPGGSTNAAGWGGSTFSAPTPWMDPGTTLDFTSATGAAMPSPLSQGEAPLTGPVTLDPVAFAGLGRRMGGTAVDAVIGLVGAALVAFVAYVFWIIAAVATRTATVGEEALTGLAVLGILAVLFWLYDAGLESSPLRATLGKQAVGLIVVDKQGRPVSFARGTVRHLVKSVPLVLGVLLVLPNVVLLMLGLVSGLFLGVGVVGLLFLALTAVEFFMIGWTRQKQGLHDLVASTLVVRQELLRVVPATAAVP